MKPDCLASPLCEKIVTIFWALFLGRSFFGPGLGVISWAPLCCHFLVSVLCPDWGPRVDTRSELDRGVGDVAQLGWLMCGLTGSAVGHWVAAFDGFAGLSGGSGLECFSAGGGLSVGPATCLFAIKGSGADGRRRSQTAEPAEPAKPAETASFVYIIIYNYT